MNLVVAFISMHNWTPFTDKRLRELWLWGLIWRGMWWWKLF